MAYYVICDDDNKHEGMSKEQILSAIAQAVSGESVIDPDAGILTKVKETNTGGYITFWVGTQAQYNALHGATVQNCLYIITDETTQEDIDSAIEGIKTDIDTLRTSVAEVSSKSLYSYSLSKEEGQSMSTVEVAASVIETHYSSKIARVFFKGNIALKGSMSRGEEIIFTYPTGIYSPRDGDWCVLTCAADQAEYGTFSARIERSVLDTQTRLFLRSMDGFTDATVRIYMEGTFFSIGGINV